MKIVSVALTATYSSVLSLQGLDTNGPIGFGVSVAETSSDGFILYGTVDAAAVDNTNAWNLGAFTGGLGNLPRGVAEQAATWPFLLVRRTSGSTAGSLFAAGNPAASPAVVSVAAPAGTGYSALMTLTSIGAKNVRLGGSAAMTTSDVFDVFASNDATLATSAGAAYVGRICGGGGNAALRNSVSFDGYNYAIVQRVSGSTAGNIIAAGVSPSAGGGILNLTTLAVGDTAVNGPIGALTAAATVDTYSSFLLTQTTAGVTATLPNPTITTAGKFAFIGSAAASTTPIIMYGQVIRPGSFAVFEWNGAAWTAQSNPMLNQSTLAVGDTAVNGPIGALSAAATVDIFSAFVLTQTTAGVTATLPAPTVTAATRIVVVQSAAVSTQVLVMYGEAIGPGFASAFFWNGLAWVSLGYLTIGGNAYGFAINAGTIDAQNMSLKRNNVELIRLDGTSVVLLPEGAGAGQTGAIALRELAANGTNQVRLRAPDVLAADTNYILPSADGVAGAVGGGSALVTDGAGTWSWVQVQSGTGTIGAAGVSAAIVANITASSRIQATVKNFVASTAVGLEATAAGRIVGAPGSFTVTAYDAAAAAVAGANGTTFDWFVFG